MEVETDANFKGENRRGSGSVGYQAVFNHSSHRETEE
jgi:hypothetical protein